MKKSTVLIMVTLLMASLAAVEGDGWKRLPCPACGFSLELPPGWRSLGQMPGLVFAAAGAQEGPIDKFIENFTVGTAPNSPPRTIEDFWDIYLRSLPPIIDSYKFVSQGEVSIDGRPGRRLVFLQNLEGDMVKVMQVVFIKGDLVFILTFTDIPETFDPRLPDFERVVQSLKFD